MGCSTSSRVIAKESSPKNQWQGREGKNQARKNILGTNCVVSQGGSAVGDDSCGSGQSLSEDGMERFQSIKEEKGAVKSVNKIETERQTSSDILEELRQQGIIQTQSSTSKNKMADNVMMVHSERPQKPPAKLEKLEIKQKKTDNLVREETKNKKTEEQLKKELLTDSPSPIIPHESRKQIDSSVVIKTSSIFQLPPLNLETGSWTEKKELDGNIYNDFEDFRMVESDRSYNTIN